MQEKELTPRDQAKKSFVFYYDWRSRFDALTDAESKALLMAMLDYAEYGKIPNFRGNRILDAMFSTVKTLIDDDFDRWLARTNAKRENGKKGGRPPKEANTSANQETEQNLVGSVRGYSGLVEPDNDNEYVNENEYDNDNEYRPAGPGQPSRPIYDNDYVNVNVYDKGGHMVREEERVDDFYPNHPYDLMPYT